MNVLKVYAVLTIFLSGFLSGCSRQTEVSGPKFGEKPLVPKKPVYHFVVHPLHNPAKLFDAYQPLMEYINDNIEGGRFELEASKDYANFEVKYTSRNPEFLLPNPWQTTQAIKLGYHVIAMAGEAGDFKGIFIVRKDSKIKRPSQLKGMAISYPSPTALAACIMPQYFLYKNGININKDIKNSYVGSQESSIMNVFQKHTAAGATWPPPWRAFQNDHPNEASELMVIWETESLINNSVMTRDNVPKEITAQVQKILLNIHSTSQGKRILSDMETARFLPVSDKDYDIVNRYIARFERQVRPVNIK